MRITFIDNTGTELWWSRMFRIPDVDEIVATTDGTYYVLDWFLDEHGCFVVIQ